MALALLALLIVALAVAGTIFVYRRRLRRIRAEGYYAAVEAPAPRPPAFQQPSDPLL